MILTEPSELTQLQRSIRAKASKPDLFVFSVHAIQRGYERSITLIDVVRVCRHGAFSQPVFVNHKTGEYRFQIAHKVAGRKIAVQAACRTDRSGNIFIITVLELETKL